VDLLAVMNAAVSPRRGEFMFNGLRAVRLFGPGVDGLCPLRLLRGHRGVHVSYMSSFHAVPCGGPRRWHRLIFQIVLMVGVLP
jgi:hypothetical protein